MPFAAALLATVPTYLLGSNPQLMNFARSLIRSFSLETCAAHITHEGNLAALLIDAHGVAWKTPVRTLPHKFGGFCKRGVQFI